MSKLSHLSPQPLWDIFSKICSIPHSSYQEKQLATRIIKWAKKRKLYAESDQVGNVLIRKVATTDTKNRQPVVIQAHMDMVAQKNEGILHDFTKDPIYPYVDGEWVKANGTTLGADNGIGMASAIAILADEQIEHGPLEVLLTTAEETGMCGALELQANWLNGNILINTDSGKEDKIYIGCAGGINFISDLSLFREKIPTNFQVFKIIIKGLRGGHSGEDIHLGLGNANKLLARFLAKYAIELDLRLVDFNGGTAHNAIPREAFATVAVLASNINALKKAINDYLTTLKNELFKKEKSLTLMLEKSVNNKAALTIQSRDIFIQLLHAIPNGVIHISEIYNNVVETSLNVGIVTTSNDSAKIICLIRSIIDSGIDHVISILESLGSLAGAHTYTKCRYPSWQPNNNSSAMILANKTYQRLFNKKPNIQVIHAGLECGLFKKSYPGMDMVSIGPTITGQHSPNEQVHIKSVSRYWTLLTELLKVI